MPDKSPRRRVVEQCFIAENDQIGLLDDPALQDRLTVDPGVGGNRRSAALRPVHRRVLYLITREEGRRAEDPASRLDPVPPSTMKSNPDHSRPPRMPTSPGCHLQGDPAQQKSPVRARFTRRSHHSPTHRPIMSPPSIVRLLSVVLQALQSFHFVRRARWDTP